MVQAEPEIKREDSKLFDQNAFHIEVVNFKGLNNVKDVFVGEDIFWTFEVNVEELKQNSPLENIFMIDERNGESTQVKLKPGSQFVKVGPFKAEN